MRHKIIIIMPSRPSQLRFSTESVSSELSRPTRDSDSSWSGPRQIRLGRLISDSAESLNRACGENSSRAELTCYATCILLELPSIAADLLQKPVPLSPSWFSQDASVLILRPSPWPDWEFVMWFDLVVLTFYLPLHSSEMNAFKLGRMMGNRTVQI